MYFQVFKLYLLNTKLNVTYIPFKSISFPLPSLK